MSSRRLGALRASLGLTLFTLFSVLVTGGQAHASVVTTYLASNCWADTPGDAISSIANGGIKAGASGANITCPVPKLTSGPGFTNDDIFAVDLTIDTGSDPMAKMACDLLVMRSTLAGSSPTNILEDHGEAKVQGAGLTSIGFDSTTRGNFWSPAGGGWLSAEIHCALSAGVTFTSYVVAEDGDDHGYRIHPAASCKLNPGSTASYEFFPNGSNSNPIDEVRIGQVSGYIEAQENHAGDAFKLDCPVAADTRTVNLAMTASLNGTVTCGSVTVPSSPMEFQTINPPPSFSATGSFTCSQPGLGDGKLLSYRFGPAAPPAVVKVNAGGGAVSPFTADAGSSGGSTIFHNNTITLTGVTTPAPAAVYQSARVGTFTYTFGGYAAASNHLVRLHFAETYFNAINSRLFNVSINGSTVLTNFDIFATAGKKQNQAVIKEFTRAANSAGQYVIEISNANPVKDQGMLSGIEIQ